MESTKFSVKWGLYKIYCKTDVERRVSEHLHAKSGSLHALQTPVLLW